MESAGVYGGRVRSKVAEVVSKDMEKVIRKDTINPNDSLSSKAVELTFCNESGVPVGTAAVSAVDTQTGFLYNVEVFPEFRRKGYGKALVAYVLAHYPITELTVEEANALAINMYRKFGFKENMHFKDKDGRVMIDMVNGLGEKLHKLRKALWLSKEYVAKQVGVDRCTIEEIERGVRGVLPDELARFSEIFCTPVGELQSLSAPKELDTMRSMMEFKRMMKG